MFQSGVKLNRIGQWGDKIDWATVEKTKGQYVIDPEVDRGIDESVRGGIDILMTLDYGNNLYQQVPDPIDVGPTWHRSHPFLQCAPTTPEALEAWARFCGFMAGHFQGRVKYFEIWNEENGWFFDSWADNNTVPMVKKYGQALLAAAKAIREVNPEAKIVFGGTAGMTLDFPRIALDEGAGSLIDVFAFHPYGHPMPEAAASHFLSAVNGKMEWQPRPAEIKDYEGEIVAPPRAAAHVQPADADLGRRDELVRPGRAGLRTERRRQRTVAGQVLGPLLRHERRRRLRGRLVVALQCQRRAGVGCRAVVGSHAASGLLRLGLHVDRARQRTSGQRPAARSGRGRISRPRRQSRIDAARIASSSDSGERPCATMLAGRRRLRFDCRRLSRGRSNSWTRCTATSSRRWCGTSRTA